MIISTVTVCCFVFTPSSYLHATFTKTSRQCPNSCLMIMQMSQSSHLSKTWIINTDTVSVKLCLLKSDPVLFPVYCLMEVQDVKRGEGVREGGATRRKKK